ncbi:MAG: hypothetical protein M5R36_04630 [Deltaproteobacteria bacterium]|nr:hypothetical protein [Deltaproteobacteria bacterium]
MRGERDGGERKNLDGARVAFLQGNAINESLGLTELAGHLKAQGVVGRLFLEREEPALPEKTARL